MRSFAVIFTTQQLRQEWGRTAALDVPAMEEVAFQEDILQ